MSILSRPKLSPQQRFDLEDWNALIAAACGDSKLRTQKFWSSDPYVLNGFVTSGIGNTTANVALAGGALIAAGGGEKQSWFVGASAEPAKTVALQAGTKNYLEISLAYVGATELLRAFWDATANGGVGAEFNQLTDTIQNLEVTIETSVSGFSGDADKIPLSIVETNGAGTIIGILDQRDMFGRLGQPQDEDRNFLWGTNEEVPTALTLSGIVGAFTVGETITFDGAETAEVVSFVGSNLGVKDISSPTFSPSDAIVGVSSGATATLDTYLDTFIGADKDLGTLKENLDAIKTEIKFIKGIKWFERSNNSLNGLTQFLNSIITQNVAGASYAWDGSALSITDDSGSPANTDELAGLRILGNSQDLLLTRQDAVSAAIAIADGEVMFVKLPDSGDRTYSDAGAGDTNYQVVTKPLFEANDTNYWIAYREGDRLYVRGYGELQPGEEAPISDPAKAELEALISAGQAKSNQDRNMKLIQGGTWANPPSFDTVLTSVIEQTDSSLNANNPTIDSYSGQTFTVTSEITVAAIELALGGAGSAPNGLCNLAIWGVDGSTEPDETNIIATATPVDVTGFPDPPPIQIVQFNFPTPVTLAPGTYAWMADTNDMTSGFLRFRGSNANPYAGGQFYGQTAPPTGAWSTNASIDLYFRILESSQVPSTDTTVTLSQDAYIQIPGLADIRNTISAQTITLPNATSVAYVETNRDGVGAAVLTVLVADIDAVTLTDNTKIILRNTPAGVLVGDSFLLKNGEKLELDGALAEINRYFGQLRIKANDTLDQRVAITGVDITKLDSAVLGQTLSNLLLDFGGAQIDFSTGEIFEEDGTTPLGLNFTPATIAASQWQWYSVTLLPSTVASNNKITGTLLVLPADATGATKDAAPRAPFSDGGIPLGQVVVQQNVGNTAIEVISDANVVQIGIGAGSGGSGSGNANSFLDLLTDVMVDSIFEAVGPYIAETDTDDAALIDPASTGSYSIVDKRFKLAGIGDTLISEQVLDSTFLDGNSDLPKIKLIVKYDDDSGIDTGATYEVTRNNGAEYQAVTMERVDESSVFAGTLDFADEATQNTITGDGAITGANLVMTDVAGGTPQYSQPFNIASKTFLRKAFGNIQDINGSLQGTLSLRIVKDVAGSPSTDVNDIVLESVPHNLASAVAGEIEFGITKTSLDVGDYHIVMVTDDAYKAVYDSGVIDFSLGANDAGTGAQEFDGAAWSTVAGDFALTHRLEGFPLVLKVRITSSITDALVEGFGVLFDLGIASVSNATLLDGLTKASFNAVADNSNEFVLPFMPNQLLVVHLLGSGQSFRYGDFSFQGNTVVFAENQFNNGGVEKVQTLVFDNVRGSTFDNSDVNGALAAANHLGSSDPAIDKSVEGRGIILKRPDGTKREITIDDFDNIVIYSVD